MKASYYRLDLGLECRGGVRWRLRESCLLLSLSSFLLSRVRSLSLSPSRSSLRRSWSRSRRSLRVELRELRSGVGERDTDERESELCPSYLCLRSLCLKKRCVLFREKRFTARKVMDIGLELILTFFEVSVTFLVFHLHDLASVVLTFQCELVPLSCPLCLKYEKF